MARKNRIVYLSDESGNPLTTQHQTSACFNNYFRILFTTSHNAMTVQSPIYQPQFSQAISSDFTNSIPDKAELWNILKNMKRDAAPGPDGLNVAFYRATWQWIGDDVVSLVQNFYLTGMLPSKLKKTFIVLIPKKLSPVVPQDFRPISLCNVIYKIIAKSLADRIKPHLPDNIHISQSAFIPGRHIASDIIFAQEITHSFSLSSWNHKGFL